MNSVEVDNVILQRVSALIAPFSENYGKNSYCAVLCVWQNGVWE
jgi:hypothetical protein